MAEVPASKPPKVDVSEPKEVEETVVAGLQASTSHPPLLQAPHQDEPELPPPISRATSALSTAHIIRKEDIKTNLFGIMQRLHGASSVAIAVRNASPEEQKEVLDMIDDTLNHLREKDAGTLAAMYTIVSSNHDVEGFEKQHRRVCHEVEKLPLSVVAEMRDIIDLSSEGRGFLPLVLMGGMDHYKRLASKFSATVTEGYTLPHRCMKIFSDIDDTVIANWVDLLSVSRYGWKPKSVYPGVRELHHRIIEHAKNPSHSSVDLIFLSARPLKHQLNTIDALKKWNFGVPSPGSFTLLYGEFMSNLSPSTMGRFKYSMFKLYSALYPHMDYVFFGDSGQGDFHCGELMIRDVNPGSSCLKGVFIHEIRRPSEIFRQVDPATPTMRLHYFYHYGQAAQQALTAGLISQEDYEKVIDVFVRESKQAAKDGMGDPEKLLATFNDTQHTGPAEISKAQDMNNAQ